MSQNTGRGSAAYDAEQQRPAAGSGAVGSAGAGGADAAPATAARRLLQRTQLSGRPFSILFLIWYAIGFILMVFGEVPRQLEFANGVFLLLFALSLSELAAEGLGWRRLALPLLLVSLGTFAVEWVGTHTGFPFGEYTYADTLGLLVSGVPWTMGLAWVGVMLCGALLSTARSRVWRAIETGAWVLALDAVLDPVAEARGFWDWAGGGFYYGIPTVNFISWFVIGALLSLLLPVLRTGPEGRTLARRLYQLMLLLFGLLALKEGLYSALALSLLFIAASEGRSRLDSRRQKPVL